jgi:ParB family chromosome partitioning protein
MKEEMVYLEIEKVDPPIDAARDLIDPEMVRELAESIRSQGLLQPILARPMNGRFEVVAGHRRLLAHRLIGEVTIKSLVREMTDEEVEIVRATENDQREDLNPIEKAKGYKKLRDKHGLTVEQIAQKMGRNRDTIFRFLNLLKIPDVLQSAVAKKKMSIGVALVLNEIEDESWQNLYYPSAIENGATVEVAQSWVNEYRKFKGCEVGDQGGGLGDVGQIQESLPIYQPCVCCLGPVELSKLRMIYVCRECETQIRGALKPQ